MIQVLGENIVPLSLDKAICQNYNISRKFCLDVTCKNNPVPPIQNHFLLQDLALHLPLPRKTKVIFLIQSNSPSNSRLHSS